MPKSHGIAAKETERTASPSGDVEFLGNTFTARRIASFHTFDSLGVGSGGAGNDVAQVCGRLSSVHLRGVIPNLLTFSPGAREGLSSSTARRAVQESSAGLFYATRDDQVMLDDVDSIYTLADEL